MDSLNGSYAGNYDFKRAFARINQGIERAQRFNYKSTNRTNVDNLVNSSNTNTLLTNSASIPRSYLQEFQISDDDTLEKIINKTAEIATKKFRSEYQINDYGTVIKADKTNLNDEKINFTLRGKAIPKDDLNNFLIDALIQALFELEVSEVEEQCSEAQNTIENRDTRRMSRII